MGYYRSKNFCEEKKSRNLLNNGAAYGWRNQRWRRSFHNERKRKARARRKTRRFWIEFSIGILSVVLLTLIMIFA